MFRLQSEPKILFVTKFKLDRGERKICDPTAKLMFIISQQLILFVREVNRKSFVETLVV